MISPCFSSDATGAGRTGALLRTAPFGHEGEEVWGDELGRLLLLVAYGGESHPRI